MSPKSKVLDSWALLAYFEGQASAICVKELLWKSAEEGQTLLMSAVNWGEVLYTIERRYGKKKCQEIEHLMKEMHIRVVPADEELARQAAHFKATVKLPYSDCFAAALAYLQKTVLVTGDWDFQLVADKVNLLWLS